VDEREGVGEGTNGVLFLNVEFEVDDAGAGGGDAEL
jgi:hypothetical protein